VRKKAANADTPSVTRHHIMILLGPKREMRLEGGGGGRDGRGGREGGRENEQRRREGGI